MKISDRFKFPLLLVVLSLFISSCGFKAAYRVVDNPTSEFLANIEITPINSIEGAIFYDHMVNILPMHKQSLYILDVKMFFSSDSSTIGQSSDPVRSRLTVNTIYQVKEKESSRIITSGNFSKLSSFSTGFSPYSNLILQQDERKYLAIASAEEVRNRIMLFIENESYN